MPMPHDLEFQFEQDWISSLGLSETLKDHRVLVSLSPMNPNVNAASSWLGTDQIEALRAVFICHGASDAITGDAAFWAVWPTNMDQPAALCAAATAVRVAMSFTGLAGAARSEICVARLSNRPLRAHHIRRLRHHPMPVVCAPLRHGAPPLSKPKAKPTDESSAKPAAIDCRVIRTLIRLSLEPRLARSDAPEIPLVTGPAGIGKSSALKRICEQWSLSGWRSALIAANPGGTVCRGDHAAIRWIAHFVLSLAHAHAHADADDRCPLTSPDPAAVLAAATGPDADLLRAVVFDGLPSFYSADTSNISRLADAAAGLVVDAGASDPFLIAFDDADLAPSPITEFIRVFATKVQAANGVVVLAGAKSAGSFLRKFDVPCQAYECPEVDTETLVAMTRNRWRLFHQETPPARTMAALARGNPGHAIALADALLAACPQRALSCQDLPALTRTMAIPQIETELARLGPLRPLVHLLSVFDAPFCIREAASVLLMRQDQVLPLLQQLAELRVLSGGQPETGASYRFTYERVREQAYLQLSPNLRCRLHSRIAGYLISQADCDAPGRVAHHLQSAGDDRAAIDWWQTAGNAAAKAGDYASATDAFDTALQLCTRGKVDDRQRCAIELALSQQHALKFGVGTDRALSGFSRTIKRINAAEQPAPVPERINTLAGAVEALRHRGKLSAAKAALHDLEAIADMFDPAQRCEVEITRACLLFQIGQLDLAAISSSAAIRAACALEAHAIDGPALRPVLGRACIERARLAVIAALMDAPDEARTLGHSAVDLAIRIDDPAICSRAFGVAATAAFWADDDQRAATLGLTGFCIAKQAGVRTLSSYCQMFVAWGTSCVDAEQGESELDAALEAYKACGVTASVPLGCYLIARAAERRGATKDAFLALQNGAAEARRRHLGVYTSAYDWLSAVTAQRHGLRLDRRHCRRLGRAARWAAGVNARKDLRNIETLANRVGWEAIATSCREALDSTPAFTALTGVCDVFGSAATAHAQAHGVV